MLNVLHISDLHYSSKNDSQTRDAAFAGGKAIISLAKILKKKGVINSSTKILMTGDIVQSGEISDKGISDFDLVYDKFIHPLLEVLDLGTKDVFIVPGNHEMDRMAISDDARLQASNHKIANVTQEKIDNDLKVKLKGYFEFVEKYGINSVTLNSPRVNIFNVSGQSIAIFNGLAGAYSLRDADDKGQLFINNSEFGSRLADIPNQSIVLTHHPLSWYEDQCAIDFKEFLASRKCRLLTGHIHDQGADWIETKRGTLAVIQAGASADAGRENQVAVGWFPPSNSAAVRHYTFDKQIAEYPITDPSQTRVLPEVALGFFEKTEAFFSVSQFENSRKAAALDNARELEAVFGRDLPKYITPDIILYKEDEFSARRVSHTSFIENSNIRIISGEELSGKSSFILFSSYKENLNDDQDRLSIVLDFRLISAGRDILDAIQKKIVGFGLTKYQAEYVISVGLVSVWFDNFDPDNEFAAEIFFAFAQAHPELRWNVAVRGGQRFTPSRAPSGFPREGISYYELSEITAPTVVKMIEARGSDAQIERPRAVVERVFRSINNLRAPRTAFYVDNLVEIFLSDGSVEPLNRYLLIENLLSDKIRAAHRRWLPQQAIDMEMLEAFIGQVAHFLLMEEKPYLTKGEFYTLADGFISRKGLQRKRFDPDAVLNILTDSFVLREYDGSFGFMMLSVEDYFLAKHMGKDEAFRDEVMSSEGLESLPTVAEYYIAQNPSDRKRIDAIFEIIGQFEKDVWSIVEEIKDIAKEAIKSAAPGSMSDLKDSVVEALADVEKKNGESDDVIVVSETPRSIGRTRRLRYAPEERGAIFLQLGASILGVTRTLDQVDRIEIFKRIRSVMMICFYTMPFVAQYLADDGVLRFRGISVRAQRVGALSVDEDRFYLILRGMLYNAMKQFATWSGSPSFFNAAAELRKGEECDVIKAALLAQNIEADLSEAIDVINRISTDFESTVVKEVIVRLFVDALTLVPLDRADEARAIDQLVDATIDLNPPKRTDDASLRNQHKVQVRQDLMDKVGLNAYVGKLVKPLKARDKGAAETG